MQKPFSGSIYVICNRLDGRVYVGQTKKPVEDRMYQHFKCEKLSGEQLRGLSRIDLAIAKKGRAAFTWRVIDQGVPSKELLDALEAAWILALKSADPSSGYNQTLGNTNGREQICIDDAKLSSVRSWIAAESYSTREARLIVELDAANSRIAQLEAELATKTTQFEAELKAKAEQFDAELSAKTSRLEEAFDVIDQLQHRDEFLRSSIIASVPADSQSQDDSGSDSDTDDTDDKDGSNIERWLDGKSKSEFHLRLLDSVRQDYKRWCKAHRETPVGRNHFGRELESVMGVTRTTVNLTKSVVSNNQGNADIAAASAAGKYSCRMWVDPDKM